MHTHSFKTNFLVIGFNRSDLLEASLNRLQKFGKSNIWVSIDGPRPGNTRDQEENRKIKKILDKFSIHDDQRQISYLNLGCRNGVIQAISWFFDHNHSGIILEDDIEIDDNYLFCMQYLLEKFHDNLDVFSISSHSELAASYPPREAHELISMPVCRVWGWAAWRRSWLKHLDILNETRDYTLKEVFSLIPKSYRTFDAALRLYQCKNNSFDTWDYEWNLTHLLSRSTSITPCNNFCLNHGFGDNATHTLDSSGCPWSTMNSFDLSVLNSSIFSISNVAIDEINAIVSKCGFPISQDLMQENIKLYKHQIKSMLKNL
jgi:hypothetical protein